MNIEKIGRKWRVTGFIVREDHKGHNSFVEIDVLYGTKRAAEAAKERFTQADQENREMNARARQQRYEFVAAYLAKRAARPQQLRLF